MCITSDHIALLCRNPRKGHTLSEILREMWWTLKHHSNCKIGAFGNVFKCADDYLKRIQVNIAKEIAQKDWFLGLNYKDSIVLPLNYLWNSNDDTHRCCKVAYHFSEFKGQASPVAKRIPQLTSTVPLSDHMYVCLVFNFRITRGQTALAPVHYLSCT